MFRRALVALALVLAAPAWAETLELPLAKARQLYQASSSRYAMIDGIDVHYRSEGKGPAVLLVHGSYGDLGDWDEWTRLLQSQFRVVRFDLPGYALSGPVPSGDYSVDQNIRLIDGLMTHLGIETFAVVGASSGAPAVFRYAASHPARVNAVVLMNAAGVVAGNRAAARPNQPAFGQVALSDISEASLRVSLEGVMNDPHRISAALVRRKFDLARVEGRIEEGRKIVAQYRRGEPLPVLAQIAAPTMVLWGGANKALPPVVADNFAVALTGSRHVEKRVIDDGAHMLHLQKPQASGRAVRDFLKRWGRGRPPSRSETPS